MENKSLPWVLLGLILLVSCGKKEAPDPQVSTARNRAIIVSDARFSASSIHLSLEALGKLLKAFEESGYKTSDILGPTLSFPDLRGKLQELKPLLSADQAKQLADIEKSLFGEVSTGRSAIASPIDIKLDNLPLELSALDISKAIEIVQEKEETVSGVLSLLDQVEAPEPELSGITMPDLYRAEADTRWGGGYGCPLLTTRSKCSLWEVVERCTRAKTAQACGGFDKIEKIDCTIPSKDLHFLDRLRCAAFNEQFPTTMACLLPKGSKQMPVQFYRCKFPEIESVFIGSPKPDPLPQTTPGMY